MSDLLRQRFCEVLAERGVSAAGADALLVRIGEAARLSRTGRLTDEQASARVALLLIATEEKAAELRREAARPLARAVADGRMSLLSVRARIRGAA